jgi:hypothetical protein
MNPATAPLRAARATAPPVSLQISLAPPDLHHASHVVPHQLRALASQADEVLLVVDFKKSSSRRWRSGWDALAPRLRSLLETLAQGQPGARVLEVDYSQRSLERVARRFFARSSIPAKDLRGGPFFAYFFALDSARHDHVLHLDSDMLIGGGSRSWVSEAVHVLACRTEVLSVCPLPGPPAHDGLLRQQEAHGPVREDAFRFRFRHFTSRVFLCDRNRVADPDHPLPLVHEVPWWGRISGGLRQRSTFALPERLVTLTMRRRGLIRIDLLGEPPGLWTVHPVQRDAQFRRTLPDVIARVERGEVSESQLGRYDLVPAMISPDPALSA